MFLVNKYILIQVTSSSKTIFAKASNQSTKEKVNKVKHVHHYPKKRFVEKKILCFKI